MNDTQRYYEPWKGSEYDQNPYGGVRLLLVGESSFKRPGLCIRPTHLKDDTKLVLTGELKPKCSGFWRFIQRSVTGRGDLRGAALAEFWNGVALVNLVQKPMDDKDKRPTAIDFANGAHVLRGYIEELTPQGVIVYSKTSWDYVKSAMEFTSCLRNLIAGSSAVIPALAQSVTCWRSQALARRSPFFLLLRHPSARPKLAGVLVHQLVGPFLDYCRRGA